MPEPSSARFRLNATTVSSHFKYRCDRRFRWNAVPRALREVPGTVGEGVPKPPRQDTRPGVKELMSGGDDFELGELRHLEDREGEALVWAGPTHDAKKGYDTVGVLPFDRLLDVLRRPGRVRFVAQPQIGYDAEGLGRPLRPAEEAFNRALNERFCARFGLDPRRVEVGLSRPDLLELVPPDAQHPRPRLRVWDFKSSRSPRTEHFMQVAWYTFLLEAVAEVVGDLAVEVDADVGAVKTHAMERRPDGTMQPAEPTFDLGPYRRELDFFLRAKAPGLLALAADEAHWHVQAGCLGCEHYAHCYAYAEATRDVSRIPYLTSESRRRLVNEGLGRQAALAALADAVDGADPAALERVAHLKTLGHDLNLRLDAYLGAAQALQRVDVLLGEAASADAGLAERLREGRAEAERLVAMEQAERWFNRPCILMPSYENVRIVVAAEQDAVTHRCYALGFRVVQFEDGHVVQDEEAFVSAVKPSRERPNGDEGELLEAFLAALFERLRGIDAGNRAVNAAEIPEDGPYRSAKERYVALYTRKKALEAEIEAMRGQRSPEATAQRKAINAELDTIGKTTRGPLFEAKTEMDTAWRAAERVRRPKRLSVQFYAYDPLDLTILREAVERHLFADETAAERFALLRDVARLVPPSSMLPSASTFRTLPVTVVQQVLRQSVALPAPYLYDLRTVSGRLRGLRPDDTLTGTTFRPAYGFHWPPSNQIAFERIHDVWKGEAFDHSASNDPLGPVLSRDGQPLDGVAVVERGGERRRVYTPEAVREQIRKTLLQKLRATDSVVRILRERLNARKMDGTLFEPGEKEAMRQRGEWPKSLLPFPKEPFYLTDVYDPSAPLDASTDRLFEALDTFTVLEESYAELQLKQGHTAPADERAARFEAIAGLAFVREENGVLVFAAPPEARDSKRSAADLSLVLTNADDPSQLLADVDGELFRNPLSPRGGFAKVAFVKADFSGPTPLLWLRPENRTRFDEKVDLTRPCVLDEAYADFNSPKTLDALRRLRGGRPGDGADHVRDLVRTGTMPAFRPFLREADAHYAALEQAAQLDRSLLNAGQRRAFRSAFDEPLTLVWGPPGTGKTHTVAHTVLALAAAAHAQKRPLRVLVSAQSHYAIANVLKAVAKHADAYGLDGIDLFKVISAYGLKDADASLPDDVELVADRDSASGSASGALRFSELLRLLEHGNGVTVVGATVWATHKMTKAWRGLAAPPPPTPVATPDTGGDDPAEAVAGDGPPVAPLFDIVLIDEASQLKLADALIALSALRPGGSVILAGDDQQLPPILRGTYPPDTAPFLTSVFAFMRHRMEARMAAAAAAATLAGEDAAAAAAEVERRTLCLLDENFRMNHPLTEYPRRLVYGTYTSTRPRLRLHAPGRPADPLDAALLDPERPVVLVRYAAPRAFTARNPIEAALAVRIVEALYGQLLRPDGSAFARPQPRRHGDGQELPGEAFAAEGVAVIAPHRAQNATVRGLLREVGFAAPDRSDRAAAPALADGLRVMPLVDTVDKAQGQEFDAVVVSYGVADEAYAEAESAFLLSKNRFNVAVTRARAKVIVLVSDAVMQVVPADQQVLLDGTMLKGFADYCDDGEETFGWTTPDGETVSLRVSWKGFDPA